MEIKLVCLDCGKEMLHDVEIIEDNVFVEIYPCGHCKKEREKREEDARI